MEQQRALNALEPYLALSKSATSPRAAADLITQATSAPQTYVFTELLSTPNIQALRNSQEYLPHLHLLEIFAWGTISDYHASSNLPKLSPAQHSKLLLLSLLPLCSKPTTLSYSALQSHLFQDDESDDAQLETLVTQAIYASLISAHLDPLNRVVRVTSTAPLRDLAPNSVPGMVTILSDWEVRCDETLNDLESQIVAVRARAKDDKLRSRQGEKHFEDAVSQATEQAAKRGEGQDQRAGGRSGGMNGGGNDGGGGGAFGMLGAVGNKMWGNMMGRGGKRAGGPGAEEDEDIMEIDEDESHGGGGGGGSRSRGAKRTGRYR